MRSDKRQKGSITVFSIIMIMLVTGFLLTLLEGTRINELQRIAKFRSQMAAEAAFANYNSTLWETYHLLGSNQKEIEKIITESAGSGYSEYEYGVNLLLLELQSVDITGYTLMTDGDGTAYIHAVASYMKNNILYETAKTIFNQYEAIKNLLETKQPSGTEITDAIESLDGLQSQKMQKGGSGGNTLEYIERIRKTQLLELVVEDTTQLSSAEYDMSKGVSNRELQKGLNPQIQKTDWLDRVLLQQYLLTYFADYSNPESGRGLRYELEYLIGGKDSDIENLRTVVNELLLIRETANFVYLLSDVEKVEQASILAWALAGASANPAIVEVVKIGLLLAWAFAESVLDVRALLQGKQIPLIKSRELWTLAIENIGSITDEYLVAKESDVGISYKTYLGILILFQTESSLAKRAMDVQEITMQKRNSSVQMDHLVVQLQISSHYKAAPVFASLQRMNGNSGWNYQIKATTEYSYN